MDLDPVCVETYHYPVLMIPAGVLNVLVVSQCIGVPGPIVCNHRY